MEKNRLEVASFLVFCSAILILTFFVFQPFLNILVLAAVLAMLFYPSYIKVLSFRKIGKNLLAFIMVLFGFIFVIIPILFFGLKILEQMQAFFTLMQHGGVPQVQSIQHSVESLVRHLSPSFSFDISYYASLILTFISDNFGELISRTAFIFFQIFFLLVTFFFFLRDGEEIFFSLISFSPFREEQTRKILESIHNAIVSVMRGTLLVAVIRWVLMTVALYLLGVPDALLWGSIAGIIGAIPGLGTLFVIVPVVIYSVLQGNILLAVGAGSFGMLIFFFIDNMLSGYFFSGGLNVPPVFILFSIIGGVMFFGPLGFIFGPIILSLFISTLNMYKMLIIDRTSVPKDL